MEDANLLHLLEDQHGFVKSPFALLAATLREARTTPDQIECLALNLGPGSYTGVRAGISMAQGWSLARPIRLIGLTTFDSLSQQAFDLNVRGRVHILLDAQRGEFFVAPYEITSAGPRPLQACYLASLAEVLDRAQRGESIIGPEVSRWVPQGRDLSPNAKTLGLLASRSADPIRPEDLRPQYGRETTFVKSNPPTYESCSSSGPGTY